MEQNMNDLLHLIRNTYFQSNFRDISTFYQNQPHFHEVELRLSNFKHADREIYFKWKCHNMNTFINIKKQDLLYFVIWDRNPFQKLSKPHNALPRVNGTYQKQRTDIANTSSKKIGFHIHQRHKQDKYR